MDLIGSMTFANSQEKGGVGGRDDPLYVRPNVYESVWGFDPSDPRLAKLAITLVQPRRTRTVVLRDTQKLALAARLLAARQNRTQLAV